MHAVNISSGASGGWYLEEETNAFLKVSIRTLNISLHINKSIFVHKLGRYFSSSHFSFFSFPYCFSENTEPIPSPAVCGSSCSQIQMTPEQEHAPSKPLFLSQLLIDIKLVETVALDVGTEASMTGCSEGFREVCVLTEREAKEERRM